MLRESYLERVTRLSEDMARRAQRSRGQQRDLPAGMVDLLDLLRVATLDTVEAISLWRLSQVICVSVSYSRCTLQYTLALLVVVRGTAASTNRGLFGGHRAGSHDEISCWQADSVCLFGYTKHVFFLPLQS